MRKTSKNLIMSGTTAVLLAMIAATPLHSAPANGKPVVITGRVEVGRAVERIHYADLNLASERGQAQLHRRVSAASNRVCTPQALGVSVSDEEFAECALTARSNAKPDVARAIERARQIAANGTSDIKVVALSIGTDI